MTRPKNASATLLGCLTDLADFWYRDGDNSRSREPRRQNNNDEPLRRLVTLVSKISCHPPMINEELLRRANVFTDLVRPAIEDGPWSDVRAILG